MCMFCLFQREMDPTEELLIVGNDLLQDFDCITAKNQQMWEGIQARLEAIIPLKKLIEDKARTELAGINRNNSSLVEQTLWQIMFMPSNANTFG